MMSRYRRPGGADARFSQLARRNLDLGPLSPVAAEVAPPVVIPEAEDPVVISVAHREDIEVGKGRRLKAEELVVIEKPAREIRLDRPPSRHRRDEGLLDRGQRPRWVQRG